MTIGSDDRGLVIAGRSPKRKSPSRRTEIRRLRVYEYFFSSTVLIELIQIREYTLNLIPPLARFWDDRGGVWLVGDRAVEGTVARAQASPLRRLGGERRAARAGEGRRNVRPRAGPSVARPTRGTRAADFA